jgi:hypothetical protein
MSDRDDLQTRDWEEERSAEPLTDGREFRPTVLVCPEDNWSEVFDGPPDAVIRCSRDGCGALLVPYVRP